MGSMDYKDYIHDLVYNLSQTYGVDPNSIEIEIDADDISIDIDSGIPCGLIIVELVSNALKHAFPNGRKGKIRIALNHLEEGNKIEIKVSDNGVGFPSEFDFRKAKSIGFQIIRRLSERKLKGLIELNQDKGTEFVIQF